MQEEDRFCWSLKCEMSPAFTPDGLWGGADELKSKGHTANLVALDEQVIFPLQGDTCRQQE